MLGTTSLRRATPPAQGAPTSEGLARPLDIPWITVAILSVRRPSGLLLAHTCFPMPGAVALPRFDPGFTGLGCGIVGAK